MLDDFQNQGGFYGSTPAQPRPFYYRVCWHIWGAFLNRRAKKEGPAARADMEAAKKVWAELDDDTKEFFTFVFQFDSQWANVRDCARIHAVKRRRTLTGVISAFDKANRQLAEARGIIDKKGETQHE